LICGEPLQDCVVVAELGVNHNGSEERALRLLDAACAAGADAVKLQFFVPEQLCSRVHRADEIDMLTRYRLSDEAHARICAAAAARGLAVWATPFDEPSLNLLLRFDLPLIKVGSGEVTHAPFLARVAQTGRPVILSTGGCDWGQLDRAVATLGDHGCRKLSLLHCVSAYPPPDGQLHLRCLTALRERYPGCEIGFSDHTLGHEAACAAVVLGARLIEKHLTLDCRDDGPDHAASADPPQFAALVRAVRRVEQMLGSGEKRVQPCEGTIGRSVVAARNLPAGSVLTECDLAYKRPGCGVRPNEVAMLLGRTLLREVSADELIQLEAVAPSAGSPGDMSAEGETGVIVRRKDAARRIRLRT